MIRHCEHCGASLPGRPPVQCEHCQGWIFFNAKPAAGAVIVEGGRFLAVRRANEPAAGFWGLPGGFCEGTEHPAEAAVREVFEETGLRVTLGPLIGLYTDNYAYQGEAAPTLNTYYLARLEHADQLVVSADDAADAGWFDMADTPPFAFDHLNQVIADASALLDRQAG
jgi:8-oxo-dGTP diphosphatase